MRRFLVLAALVAAVALGAVVPAMPAVAQTPTEVTFVAVDAVEVRGAELSVTGIAEGQAAPMTYRASFWSGSDVAATAQQLSNCQRFALLAMEKPGAYRLRIRYDSIINTSACRLTRVNP